MEASKINKFLTNEEHDFLNLPERHETIYSPLQGYPIQGLN